MLILHTLEKLPMYNHDNSDIIQTFTLISATYCASWAKHDISQLLKHCWNFTSHSHITGNKKLCYCGGTAQCVCYL